METTSTASGVHPLFATILAAHGLAESDANVFPARRAAYVASLIRMDWVFEDSDDHGVWTRGRAELIRLREERMAVDPDGALWRLHAHPDYKCEVPA